MVDFLTGPDGHYAFNNLADGHYRVVPSKTDFQFAPPHRNAEIAGASVALDDIVGSSVFVTLPLLLDFEDGNPTAHDADWVDLGNNDALTVVATPTIGGVLPSGAYAMKLGPGSSDPHSVRYLAQANLGRTFKISAGLRIQAMYGIDNHDIRNDETQFYVVETNESGVPQNGIFVGGNSVSGAAERRQFGYYSGGVKTYLQNAQVLPGGTTHAKYLKVRLEFPAGGSGTASYQFQSYAPDVYTYNNTVAVDIDVSSWNLDELQFHCNTRYDSGFNFWPFVWVGALTDDWPS